MVRAAVAVAICAVPGLAAAANAGHAPTPVQWPDGPCVTVVDRTIEPIVAIDYGIPFEDTAATTDEVADSRTHQFFAVCQSPAFHVFMPRWISQMDVDAGAALGLVQPRELAAEDVLDTSVLWADCAWRITPDDARRPITFAAAVEGVQWDTAGLPAGVYYVQGHTHEPPKSQWTPRPGVYKLLDGGDAGAVGPAVSVTNGEHTLYANEAFAIEGCVDADPDATITAEWASVAGELVWSPFVQDQPVDGEAFALPFVPPEPALGELVVFRVVVTDAQARMGTAYSLQQITVLDDVLPCDDPNAICEDDGADETSGGPGGEESSTAGETGGPAQTEDGDAGCGCTSPRPSRAPWLAFMVLALGARRAR